MWLELIEDSLDGKLEENKFSAQKFKEILDAIYQPKIDPALLAEIKDEAAWEDVKREERKEGFEEGIQRGLEHGLQTGLQKGLEQGLQQGLEQGEKRKAIETARKMLGKGFCLEEVADLIGLTVNDLTLILEE